MIEQVKQFIFAHHAPIWIGCIVLFVAQLAWNGWRRKCRGPHFPNRHIENILFEENFTSGRSLKSIFTRIGGASRCLRVAITDDTLWIALHFPFNLIVTVYDIEHQIPLEAITNVEKREKSVRITFRMDYSNERIYELNLRHADKFCDTLRSTMNSRPAT